MKIKIKERPYEQVVKIIPKKHKKPKKANLFFRTLLKIVSYPDLKSVKFKAEKIGMNRLLKKEPCLFLMNHSSFVDLEIVSSLLYPRPFNIIATSDSFIGKNWLMRQIGCIPTKKFTTDLTLVRDMIYTVKNLKSSIVLFPEASYSFDGTATPLPDTLGKCVKMLGVPVVMIKTYGAFSRDPLYNNLQRRKVNVSATEEYVFSKEDVENLSEDEIQNKINELFTFDNFKWQKENQIKIDAPFRADYLNRVLYKCPNCNAEGNTYGKGDSLVCNNCGKEYFLDEFGSIVAKDALTEYDHIPNWYKWQREEVKSEIQDGKYNVDLDVDICMVVDTKCVYRVGEGKLLHTKDGFHLTGCNGQLDYKQRPLSSYSVYSDFNWYEVGDVICIGNTKALYYCFPKTKEDIVAKIRLAAEEIYKIVKKEKLDSRVINRKV